MPGSLLRRSSGAPAVAMLAVAMLAAAALVAAALVAAIGPSAEAAAAARARCAGSPAAGTASPILALDPRAHAPRVFAVQFKQDLAQVASYGSFAAAVDCALRRYVVPYLARDRPNVVVLDEVLGLATIATGSRGRAVRALVGQPGGPPSCRGQATPCAALAVLNQLHSAYAKPLAYYARRFGRLDYAARPFLAATDVFARGFARTMSDLARRYGVYVIASNWQAPFRESRRPSDVAALADPDVRHPRSVFVATSSRPYNLTFVWAPRDVRRSGPAMLRNVVSENRKVPLTPLEAGLGLAPGPTGGAAARANLRPYAIPGTPARLGLATSLPAFAYGPSAPGHECDDVSRTYMNCLDSLGANVLVQAEANDGAWTGKDGGTPEPWQPLAWMGSAWRAVSDPGVHFAYAVNPFLVGNLADLPFDGQSAILQRGLRGRGCNYIGDSTRLPEDIAQFAPDAGPKSEFLALAPWVAPDAPRDALRAIGAGLQFGSGSPHENGYLQTALVADLPFPPDRGRSTCAGA